MERATVIDDIRQVAARVLPKGSSLYLYGSRARGDFHEGSDWDLLILLDKERITSADMDEMSYPMRELGWKINEVLNPVMYTFKDWESKRFTPFYKNVMKEGVAL